MKLSTTLLTTPTWRLLQHAIRPSASVLGCQQQRSLTTAQSVLPQARYGGRQTVAMLKGDGIGPEMMNHIKLVVREAGCPISFEEIDLNVASSEGTMSQAILAVKRNGVALKGNVETVEGSRSKNLHLRQELNLFAYIVRCQTLPNIQTRHTNVDFVIIRENTEGEYAQLEHENVQGVVESLKITTYTKCKQIAKYAFDYAVEHGRKKVTAVHKANIMKLGDGLFLQTCGEVARGYPDIEFEGMIVDNCTMQLVSRPEQFDVMVMPNLYGNVIGNIGAALVGGPGVVAGTNVGYDYALFETGTRNSGRSLAGTNKANPVAMLLATADLMQYIGREEYSHRLRNSIWRVVGERGIRTEDIGGSSTTSEVVDAIIEDIKRK